MDQLKGESHARGGGIKLPAAVRFALIVSLLYVFLVGVKLLEGGIKALGSDFTDTLFEGVTNPLAGLFVGILAT
ncbi:MAG: sodium dependent phosphate transporter, partial [Acidimicrobiia bacterium]|nr:sodium dependent phosphate transporter [Acidimicrobiia bacterium]